MFASENFFCFKKVNREFLRCVGMTYNPAKFRFPTLKNRRANFRRHEGLAVTRTSSCTILWSITSSCDAAADDSDEAKRDIWQSHTRRPSDYNLKG